jgi:hypothetical protein
MMKMKMIMIKKKRKKFKTRMLIIVLALEILIDQTNYQSRVAQTIHKDLKTLVSLILRSASKTLSQDSFNC